MPRFIIIQDNRSATGIFIEQRCVFDNKLNRSVFCLTSNARDRENRLIQKRDELNAIEDSKITKLTESMKDEEPTSTELSPLVKAQMVKSMTLPASEILEIKEVS